MTLIIAAAIIVLAGIYCLALASVWLSGNGRAIVQPNTIVGGDRDAHGCIGSAGYSWCEARQKCLRVWEEKCDIANTDTTTSEIKNYPAWLLSLPEVFPGMKWSQTKLSLNQDAILYKENKKNVFGYQNYTPTGGIQWNAESTASPEVDKTLGNKVWFALENNYERNLSANGWKSFDGLNGAAKYGDYFINGVYADGDYGYDHAYVKMVGDKLQVIVFNQHMTPTSFKEVPDSASEPVCPCKYSFSVYVSDLIPILMIVGSN